jgi:uncharacterized protein (TIGR01777 family)
MALSRHPEDEEMADLFGAGRVEECFWNALDEPTRLPVGPVDAVIHLAGESIASGRWSRNKKKLIHQSRVGGTRNLIESLVQSGLSPRVFISASAIGIYGNRNDENLSEDSPPGTGFLGEVSRDWENALLALPATIRIACLRFGIVLGREGGMLARMLLPFRCGLGAILGKGTQWMSWVHIQDVERIVFMAMTDERFHGPHNIVSPDSVTNIDFTKTLARILSRPVLLRVPAPVLRCLFGEMAALFLDSQKVMPGKLLRYGYDFSFPDIVPALTDLVGKELTRNK